MGDTNSVAGREIGVGLISVGWMGKLHTRAYQAIPSVYPELGLRPRLVRAVDTAADRAEYARDVLGYAKASTDFHEVLADPDVDVVSICAPTGLHREIGVAAAEAEAVLDREARRAGCEGGGRRRRGCHQGGRGHVHRLQLPPRPRGGTGA